jgi:DNA-binding MarR family transcriptional regulator
MTEYCRVEATIGSRQGAVKGRGPSAEAFSALVVQVLSLAGALEAAGNALAQPAGQSAARWRVLAAVEDEPASVSAIARVLRLARQSVQRVADLLVAEGLARYRENPAHRRAKLLQLTAAGLEALRTIQVAQAGWARKVATDLDPHRLEAARQTLAELQARLDASMPDIDPPPSTSA